MQYDLEKLLATQEDLNPELREYYEAGDTFPVIRHPLIYSVPHFDQMNAVLNARLAAKKEAVFDAENDRQWATYIWLHERPFRLDAFRKIEDELSDEEYWSLLGSIWVDSENIWQYKVIWKVLLKKRFTSRLASDKFMSEADRRVFANLPDKLEIYRGYIPGKNKNGMSYSLYEKKAKWFADRFGAKGAVVKRVVKKSQVFAYMNGRGEHEIIVV